MSAYVSCKIICSVVLRHNLKLSADVKNVSYNHHTSGTIIWFQTISSISLKVPSTSIPKVCGLKRKSTFLISLFSESTTFFVFTGERFVHE